MQITSLTIVPIIVTLGQLKTLTFAIHPPVSAILDVKMAILDELATILAGTNVKHVHKKLGLVIFIMTKQVNIF